MASSGDSEAESPSPGQSKLQVLFPFFPFSLRALATKCCVALIFCRVHLNYMAADRNSSEKCFSDDENAAAAAKAEAQEPAESRGKRKGEDGKEN